MLTYTSAPADAQLLVTRPFGSSSPSPSSDKDKEGEDDTDHNKGNKTELFDPPIEEFSVLRTALDKEGEKEVHRSIEGPSIVIITEGSGKISQVGSSSQSGDKRAMTTTTPLEVKRGDVVFVAADVEVEFEAGQVGEKGFVLFRAFVEV
jgi:mannose-6-phosphate isomerase class I